MRIDADLTVYVFDTAGAMMANLCRAPNGVPVVLTTSDGGTKDTTVIDGVGNTGAGTGARGNILFTFNEASPGNGVATQYGIRIVGIGLVGGGARADSARIRVEEWR